VCERVLGLSSSQAVVSALRSLWWPFQPVWAAAGVPSLPTACSCGQLEQCVLYDVEHCPAVCVLAARLKLLQPRKNLKCSLCWHAALECTALGDGVAPRIEWRRAQLCACTVAPSLVSLASRLWPSPSRTLLQVGSQVLTCCRLSACTSRVHWLSEYGSGVHMEACVQAQLCLCRVALSAAARQHAQRCVGNRQLHE
jgi:hypothetical protein